MKPPPSPSHAAASRWGGFSFVEMLASVAIIGIIAFLAIPSISKMREDSEKNLAISRAEALNMAQSTMVQVKGRTQADLDWRNAATNDAKYVLLQPYLSYAESTLAAYLPSGYTVTFNAAINDMKKANLFGPDSARIYY
ncbi:MAG: prepilin-type N-terminal cleavage/methylation domain-containing protein [Verrucomicrobiaceae bacterium]|nr:prepilin-type N-terminal cleavage/methylation domain-containing protein [Verrucomicrobiaceae bacterium]